MGYAGTAAPWSAPATADAQGSGGVHSAPCGAGSCGPAWKRRRVAHASGVSESGAWQRTAGTPAGYFQPYQTPAVAGCARVNIPGRAANAQSAHAYQGEWAAAPAPYRAAPNCDWGMAPVMGCARCVGPNSPMCIQISRLQTEVTMLREKIRSFSEAQRAGRGRRNGFSCHQCKKSGSNSAGLELVFCTRLVSTRARKAIKPCRKKYCTRCIKKFYSHMRFGNPNSWECPSCLGVCSCATCTLRRQSIEYKKHMKLKQVADESAKFKMDMQQRLKDDKSGAAKTEPDKVVSKRVVKAGDSNDEDLDTQSINSDGNQDLSSGRKPETRGAGSRRKAPASVANVLVSAE